MDLKEKVTQALLEALKPDRIRIEDDDGITGYVVSPRFRRMSSIDRQNLLDDLLRTSTTAFSPAELRRVIMIAALTPAEFESVGVKIRVHRVKQMGGGAVEITLHGDVPDAEYVRSTLNKQSGIETTNPKSLNGLGLCFRARRIEGSRLTKAEVLALLRQDPSIEVVQSA